MDAHTTRFGAVWEPLERSVAVLRARTARHGAALALHDPVSAAAAVVAVEGWMAVLAAESLENPGRHGTPALAALAAAYTLLAGGEFGHEPGCESVRTPDPGLFVLAEDLSARVVAWGLDPGAVLVRAAAALAVGGEDPRIATLVDVLDTTASRSAR